MRVVQLDDETLGERYDHFVQSHPGGCIYYTRKYRDLLMREVGGETCTLVALDDQDIRGILPTMALEGSFGRVINSLPYFGSYGGILCTDEMARKILWTAFTELTLVSDLAATTIIENPLVEKQLPLSNADFTDTRTGQITWLNQEEDLWQRIDGSTRRNIKKAVSSGVTVERNSVAMDTLHFLHVESMAQIGGKTKNLAFFRTVSEIFTPETEYDVYVAHLDGAVVAALLVFYSAGVVEYYTPASATDSEVRSRQPMAAILWQAMCDASARGFRAWNWGGTWPSQTGVYRFKRKWAAQDYPYTYFTHVANSELLTASAEELLAAYPGYFTVPFSVLNAEK